MIIIRRVPITPAEFQVPGSLADGEKHGYAIGKEVVSRTNGQAELRVCGRPGKPRPWIRRSR